MTVDYGPYTKEEYDQALFEQIELIDLDVLLKVPGVYEAIAEYYRKPTIEQIAYNILQDAIGEQK